MEQAKPPLVCRICLAGEVQFLAKQACTQQYPSAAPHKHAWGFPRFIMSYEYMTQQLVIHAPSSGMQASDVAADPCVLGC